MLNNKEKPLNCLAARGKFTKIYIGNENLCVKYVEGFFNVFGYNF